MSVKRTSSNRQLKNARLQEVMKEPMTALLFSCVAGGGYLLYFSGDSGRSTTTFVAASLVGLLVAVTLIAFRFYRQHSELREKNRILHEQEQSISVFFSHFLGMVYRCRYDRNWTMEFVSEGSLGLLGYEPEALLGNKKVSYQSIVAPEYRDRLWSEWEWSLGQRKKYVGEYEIITRSGKRKWVFEHGQGVYDDEGNVLFIEGIIFDITERKKNEQQIVALQERDFLTGLYNRNHMEKLLREYDRIDALPLSIAICDIDGLRMVNSAYGHAEGDRLICIAARLIQSCAKEAYTLGRMGGGEFMVLMPRSDSKSAYRLKADIKHTIESYNLAQSDHPYSVNLSIGHSTKETVGQSVEDAVTTAEAFLQRRKLLNQHSTHSAIVSSVMATLYAKSQETEEHGLRLSSLCQAIGEELDLDQKSLDNLQLLSRLHDIGKIGTDDRILNKPARLDAEEWEEMKQHPKIGYEIAMTIPHIAHIAEYILYHHERWDGLGYPVGLSTTSIPVVSRVLAVADAYDAMTEDRIYRKATTPEEAVAEIRRCSGSQFDPRIVEAFLNIIDDLQKKEEPSIEFVS